MKKTLLLSSLCLILASSTYADTWSDNLPQSKAQAISAKKDLLIYFSGSAWDQKTKALDAEALGTDEFKKAAAEKFVLVNYDYPANLRKDPASAPKVEIAESYGIKALPTLVLADAKGRPYAATGYVKGNGTELMKTLLKLQEKKGAMEKSLTEASAKKGVDQAKAIAEVLKDVPRPSWKTHFKAELDAIAAADPKDETGFTSKFQKEEALNVERKQYQKLFENKKYEEIMTLTAESMKKNTGEDAQRFAMYQIQALLAQKKYADASKGVEEMVKLAPESQNGKSKDRYLQTIERIKKRDESLAERKKNPKIAQPAKKKSGPIVSKPIAVVSDVKVLHDELRKIEAEVEKTAIAKKAGITTWKEQADKLSKLEEQVAALKGTEKQLKEKMQEAVAAHEKELKRRDTMKDVIKTHEEMEARRTKKKDEAATRDKKVEELEKKAKSIEKAAK